jgi:hypothetical protein
MLVYSFLPKLVKVFIITFSHLLVESIHHVAWSLSGPCGFEPWTVQHTAFFTDKRRERGIRALIIHLTLLALIAYMDLMIVLAPTDVLHRNFAKYIFKNGEFQKIFRNLLFVIIYWKNLQFFSVTDMYFNKNKSYHKQKLKITYTDMHEWYLIV